MAGRIFTRVLLCVFTGIGALSCTPFHNESNSEHPMPEFAKNTRPFCLGRFTIDIPAEAQVRVITQSIEGFGEIAVHPGMTKERLLHLASSQEQKLRARPHRKEGTVLRDVVDLNDARLLVFRGDHLTTQSFDLLGYFWKDGAGYVFAYAADNDRLEIAKEKLQRAISLVYPRSNDQLPDRPGFCIDSAVVAGSDFRLERVGAAFTMPSLPGMEIKARTSSVTQIYPENLITRSEQNLPAVRALHPDLQLETLRKGRRRVADFDGLELVELANRGTPEELFQGTWEFLGDIGSLVRPSITIEIAYDDELARRNPSEEKFSADELLVFWDSMLDSFRFRRE